MFRCIIVLVVCMSAHHMQPQCQMRPEEGDRPWGTAVVEGCGSYVGTGNGAQLFWKSNQCSKLLSYLSCPKLNYFQLLFI